MNTVKGLSVIIPVLNEAGNVQPLISRLQKTMSHLDIKYELIFVDDNSADGTKEILLEMSQNVKEIKFYSKVGLRGKAFSIIEGVEYAVFDTVCMIDADLQYAPENIAGMVHLLEISNSDIVITNRKQNATSLLRKILSTGFNFVFTRFLFGIGYDTQSGLKIFKKEVFNNLDLSPSQWSFDLDFIVKALLKNYKIRSFDISFESRINGEAKVSTLRTPFELARASLELRFKVSGQQVREKYRINAQQSNAMENV